jgi:hypothetical protein
VDMKASFSSQTQAKNSNEEKREFSMHIVVKAKQAQMPEGLKVRCLHTHAVPVAPHACLTLARCGCWSAEGHGHPCGQHPERRERASNLVPRLQARPSVKFFLHVVRVRVRAGAGLSVIQGLPPPKLRSSDWQCSLSHNIRTWTCARDARRAACDDDGVRRVLD